MGLRCWLLISTMLICGNVQGQRRDSGHNGANRKSVYLYQQLGAALPFLGPNVDGPLSGGLTLGMSAVPLGFDFYVNKYLNISLLTSWESHRFYQKGIRERLAERNLVYDGDLSGSTHFLFGAVALNAVLLQSENRSFQIGIFHGYGRAFTRIFQIFHQQAYPTNSPLETQPQWDIFAYQYRVDDQQLPFVGGMLRFSKFLSPSSCLFVETRITRIPWYSANISISDSLNSESAAVRHSHDTEGSTASVNLAFGWSMGFL